MNNRHPISEDVLNNAQLALLRGEHWMAYNQTLYLIEKEDVHFFHSQQHANEFATNNLSDRDSFNVIQFNSIKDLLERIPCSEICITEVMEHPDTNGLFNPDGNDFTDALIDHWEQQQFLSNKQIKTNVMNNDNLKYLTDNLKYMGFGENMNQALETNLKAGRPEFSLSNQTEVNKKPFEVNLNFRKSDSSDMYFFNNYKASLTRSDGEKVDQTFYLNKGKGVTAKEAYNMLEGRAVHKELTTKEGEPYKAWVQLDFDNKDKRNNYETKQFHENYGYDLKEALAKFPIVELSSPDKEDALMQSLRKGNVQSVSMEKNAETRKMFVEANPQFKNVTVYDSNMKMILKESLDQLKIQGDKGLLPTSKPTNQEQKDVATKAAISDDKKKEVTQVVKPEKEKLASKKDNSLLPKKRESKKKGLGVS